MTRDKYDVEPRVFLLKQGGGFNAVYARHFNIEEYDLHLVGQYFKCVVNILRCQVRALRIDAGQHFLHQRQNLALVVNR